MMCDINLTKVAISHLPRLNFGATKKSSPERLVSYTFQGRTTQGSREQQTKLMRPWETLTWKSSCFQYKPQKSPLIHADVLVSKLLVYGRLRMLLNHLEGGHFISKC